MPKGFEAVGLERAGVGLECNFGIGFELEQAANVAQELVDGFRRKQAGRATAHKHAVHRAAPDQGQSGFEVGSQGLQIALPRQIAAAAPLMRVEVAIGAFLQTPGQVYIQRERRQSGELDIALAVPAHHLLGGCVGHVRAARAQTNVRA